MNPQDKFFFAEDGPSSQMEACPNLPNLPSPAFSLVVKGRLPSWNDILGMQHWARYKFKNSIQEGFLSALRASANDSSTKTTSVRNSMLIAVDTLESYRQMVLLKRQSKLASAKPKKAKKKKCSSKSSTSK